MGSEFGRGYATCLLMFAGHESRLNRDLRIYNESGMDESLAVEMWANGASDHLYDLITGPRMRRDIRMVAKALASVAIECGHGYTGKKWYASEAWAWIATAKALLVQVGDPRTLEDAMAIDRRLGLRPDPGMDCVLYKRGYLIKAVAAIEELGDG